MKAALNNSSIYIEPSQSLLKYIKNLENSSDMPQGIKSVHLNNKHFTNVTKYQEFSCLLSDKDRSFIGTLNLNPVTLGFSKDVEDNEKPFLNIRDLLWLWQNLNDEKRDEYLHEILLGSNVILPQNKEIPRNEELDKRCERLKHQQENRKYRAMTKNVDNLRQPLPEDTISYQLKQINKQLLAVIQFIFSVLAGFAFGFLGVEFIVGFLDFGFRLLLGVICGLTVALAELYFLAKKLNEDLQLEIQTEKKTVHSKID